MSHEFNWALNGLNRSDFEKLPFSLLTHLGQQVEPGASHGAVNYGEEEQDEDNFDAVTTSPDAISRVSDDELKRQLLDRMAELFSNYNGAIFVTAASLTESTDKVIITLARNKKWFTKNNGRDEKFRKRLQEILRAVASGQGGNISNSPKFRRWLTVLNRRQKAARPTPGDNDQILFKQTSRLYARVAGTHTGILRAWPRTSSPTLASTTPKRTRRTNEYLEYKELDTSE